MGPPHKWIKVGALPTRRTKFIKFAPLPEKGWAHLISGSREERYLHGAPNFREDLIEVYDVSEGGAKHQNF